MKPISGKNPAQKQATVFFLKKKTKTKPSFLTFNVPVSKQLLLEILIIEIAILVVSGIRILVRAP